MLHREVPCEGAGRRRARPWWWGSFLSGKPTGTAAGLEVFGVRPDRGLYRAGRRVSLVTCYESGPVTRYESDAKGASQRLCADGVIRPNALDYIRWLNTSRRITP
jgi:hypothetical protein